MKLGKSAIILTAIFIVSSFCIIPKTLFAGKFQDGYSIDDVDWLTESPSEFPGCELKNTNIGNPCMVVNAPPQSVCYPYTGDSYTYGDQCTLQNIINNLNIGKDKRDCKIDYNGEEVNYVVFQKATSVSETEITEPLYFSSIPGQTIVLSGQEAEWGGDSPGTPFFTEINKEFAGEYSHARDHIIGKVPTIQCWTAGWKEHRVTVDIPEITPSKAILTFKNIPVGKAGIVVDGGKLILKDLLIVGKCECDADDDFCEAPAACGSIIELRNGAELVIENSDFRIGNFDDDSSTAHYYSFINIADKVGDFESRIKFIEGSSTSKISTIKTQTQYVFRFHNGKLIKAKDFEKVVFKRVGYELSADGFNSLWDGGSSNFVTTGALSAECYKKTGSNECIIKDVDKFEFQNVDSDEEVFILKKVEADEDVDQHVGVSTVPINVDEDGTHHFTLPGSGKHYIMTNLGQKIKIVDYEPEKNDTLIGRFDNVVYGTVLPTIGGTEDTTDSDTETSDSADLESESSDSSTVDYEDTLDSDVTGDLGFDLSDDEEICLKSGGTWVNGGLTSGKCEYPEVEKQASTNEGGSYGCSMTSDFSFNNSIFWAVFLVIPLIIVAGCRSSFLKKDF